MLPRLGVLLRLLLCFGFSLSIAYLDFPGCIGKVFLGSDVVAVKDVARLMAGDFHAHGFRDAGADHVADGGAAQIVKEQSGAASGVRDLVPGAAKVCNGFFSRA